MFASDSEVGYYSEHVNLLNKSNVCPLGEPGTFQSTLMSDSVARISQLVLGYFSLVALQLSLVT